MRESLTAVAPGNTMDTPATAARRAPLAAWLQLVRPRQWVKNSFVLAPLLFSGQLLEPRSIGLSLAAFALFCMAASGIYAWNDALDAGADRAHPAKRTRPVASGLIRQRAAKRAGTLLLVPAIAGGWVLAPALGGVLALYVALNALYTLRLKDVVILDVFSIATFFVLRLLAGCAAIAVQPSVWLLLCGGLLSLYLGFAKRRHELALLGDTSASHRSVLREYDAGLLDQMSVILLSVTIVAYIMYTLTSQTAAQVGSEALSYSTVFVLYGVLRYLYLVHRRNGGGDTAEVLLTDRSLLTAVGLWLLYCAWALYL